MTPSLLTWEHAFTTGPHLCGGKGYNLARLIRYGFPVPDGGVVSAEVYRACMQTLASAVPLQSLSALRADEVLTATAQEQLAAVRQAIYATDIPAHVRAELADFLQAQQLDQRPLAVRSSAVCEDGLQASFAGIHASVLNVCGVEAVYDALRTCFASLWTPQAVAYRRHMGYTDAEVLCAVVLCAMVTMPNTAAPQSAGVAFSCDPRTGRRDLIVLNAAPGLGEQVVSGAVTPEQIVFRHVSGALHLHSHTPQGPPVLTLEQARELAHHVWRIHWACGAGDTPQDVEWAYDGTRFWILQARPVTRLPRYTFAGATHLPVIWSTANIKDTVPGVVSTCAWSVLADIVDDVLYAAPAAVGYAVPPGMQTLTRMDGHAYFDLTAMQWCFYDCMAVTPAQTVLAIGGHQPEIPVPPGDPLAGAAGRRRARTRRKLGWLVLTFARRFSRALQTRMAAVRTLATLPWPQMHRDALLEAARRISALDAQFAPLTGIANLYGGLFLEILEAQLQAIAGERARALLGRLLIGSGDILSAEQGYRMGDLARTALHDPEALAWLHRHEPAQTWQDLPAHSAFRRELVRFLDDFGHRAVYEAELQHPRWCDDPSYVLDQVRQLLHTPLATDPRHTAQRLRTEAWAEVTRLTWWRRLPLAWLLKRVRQGLALRDAAKSGIVASLWPMHHLVLEVGKRLQATGHLTTPEEAFHLSKADVFTWLCGYWDGHGAKMLAQDRAAEDAAWRACHPPDVVLEGEGAPLVPPTPAAGPGFDGQVWHGLGVSSGRATAVARAIHHPHDGARLGHGEILVAPSTDPAWTPLFLRASAIVMETGGYLSHGAIVAREYGLPAVVNIPGMLAQMTDGECLAVDGDASTVRRAGPVTPG